MADLKALAEQLVNLTVKEVNELAGILKDEYGIEPAAAAVVVTSAALRPGAGAGSWWWCRRTSGKNRIRCCIERCRRKQT